MTITFVDTEIYPYNSKLQLPLYKIRAPNIIERLPYSQVIRINRISSNLVDLNNSHPSLIKEHLQMTSLLNRIDLITERDTRQKSDRIPLLIKYNRFLPNITKTIGKNWNILQIKENFKEILKNEPVRAFKRNKNIQEIIGTHWVESGRIKKDLKPLKEDKCTPCRSKVGNICCKQLKTTTTFKGQQTKQNLENISHKKL